MSSRATDAEFDTWLCAAPATLSTEQLGRTVETLCPSSLAGFLAVLEAACTARRRLNGMEFGNRDPDGRAACKVTDALGEVASALFFPVVPASPAQRRTASAVRDAPAGAGAASPAEQPGGSARYCQSTGGWSTGPGVGGYGSWSNPAVTPYLRHMSEGFSAFFAGDGGAPGDAPSGAGLGSSPCAGRRDLHRSLAPGVRGAQGAVGPPEAAGEHHRDRLGWPAAAEVGRPDDEAGLDSTIGNAAGLLLQCTQVRCRCATIPF